MNWYIKALKKYAVFDGRARRKEYWFFVLFNFIACFVLVILDVLMGTISEEGGIGLLSGIYLLAMIIPNIAVTIRRLHDTDRSGWWILISFLPFIGGIWLIVLMVLDGTSSLNQYGEDPKMEVE